MANRRHRQESRRGVLLYAVLGLAMLLAIFLFSYYTFVMSETQMTKHIMSSEVAYHIAQAGVSAGVAWFENTKKPCALRNKLIGSKVSAVNSLCEEMDIDSHAPLQEILSQYGDLVSLEVILSLDGFKPIFAVPRAVSGIVYNDVEKMGVLRVRSVATFRGTRRTLVAHKQVMVVSMLPYVVSKFTLFARELHSLGGPSVKTNHLNAMKLKRNGFEGQPAGGLTGYGYLRLNHGSQSKVEDRGWVFLGSGEERFLNLSMGRGDTGENHHLLKAPWEITSGNTLNSGYTIKFIQKGVFTDIKADNDIYDYYPFGKPNHDPIHDKAALLQLFGSANKPSATLTLGRLYRRFLMLRYARKVSTNQHVMLPFCPQAFFGPAPKPWNSQPSFDVVKEAFDDNYGRYASCMSSLYEEPYNRSFDFIDGSYTGMTPPRKLVDIKRLKHPDGLTDFLYKPDRNTGKVDIYTSDGGKLFNGNLRQVISNDLVLPPRATYTLQSKKFKNFLASKPKKIPGIVYFKGGPIVIDKELKLEEGGVICADGAITIKTPISVKANKRPLALVSLKGDITIKTEEKVQASLVALGGTLRKSQGSSLIIEGNVVLQSLDPETLLRGGGDVNITFDDRLDPTRPQNTAYACFLSPQRAYYQE